jgi:molybdopterin-guanine dinucleotide biosynthesis protein A
MTNTSFLLARTGAVLLAGGRSQRFGAEKAAAPFRGRLMMDAAAAPFAQCAIFAVSARAGSSAAQHAIASGIEVLADDPQHARGPLAGVCAGLKWAVRRDFDLLATAPCDAPLLPHDLVVRLMLGRGEAPAAYAVTEGGLHPLCAIWSVDLLPALTQALDCGSHPAVRTFLSDHHARPIHFEDAFAFSNANTPEALAALEARS